MQRALTGIQPSGTPHIGNWLGAIQPALKMQETHDCFYFIASYHALTTTRDPEVLKARVMDVAMTWLALGLDPKRATLWAQHDVPEVCELSWVLSCMASKGLLDKAHAFKDAVAKGKKEISAGLYTYPVLMAADILAFHANVVPVGQDQRQHVEMTRDMAGRFNHHFGPTLTLPDAHIQAATLIPGIDGQKMSKSHNNTIALFLPPKKLRKRIMSIQTDSTPMADPKDPKKCLVFQLFSLCATEDEVLELAGRYRRGGLGYGHAKQALFERLNASLAEPRERYLELSAHPEVVEGILRDGAERARLIARDTLCNVREQLGLHTF